MGRVAYSINQIADDLEVVKFDPQPPLQGDSDDASNEASDSRPGLTSVEPSPGASRSEASDRGIEADIDRAKEIITVHADSSDEEPSATIAAARRGADLQHWNQMMQRRRERRPVPTCFVNTLSAVAGRPIPTPTRPYPEGLPTDGRVFYLRTELGPPSYKCPAYSKPERGK